MTQKDTFEDEGVGTTGKMSGGEEGKLVVVEVRYYLCNDDDYVDEKYLKQKIIFILSLNY